jgi:hypothetical protein
MTISELKELYPVVRGRDHGPRLTLGRLLEMVGEALDAKASDESQREVACDIIDKEFLFGCWGDRWTDRDVDLLRDLRGAIISAYRAGRAKA